MPRKKVEATEDTKPVVTVSQSDFANAMVAAINAAKPVEKKNATNRVKNTPWTPKDGSPKLKLKRKMYQHGLAIGTRITNEETELLNKIKPGTYCDGHVRVVRRRDKGLDIDYPVKTAAQRLKLVNQFGIRNFRDLLTRLVDEAANPVVYRDEDELD